MSRDIHIIISGTAGSTAGSTPAGSSGGSWSYDPGDDPSIAKVDDPGNDPSIAKVDDPGNDPSIAKVDDPGNDPSIAKVDDPDGIARAVAAALGQAYGLGGHPPGSVIVQQGGGGCCCPGEGSLETSTVSPGLEAEISGFVIVRMDGRYDSLGEDPASDLQTLDELAVKYGLQGLLEALKLEPPGEGNPAARESEPSPDPPYLDSWPLILVCGGRPVRADSDTTGDGGGGAPADHREPPPDGEGDGKKPESSCRSRLRELEKAAALSPYRPLHSLLRYWRVDARILGSRQHELVAALNELGEVSLAYSELEATDPSLGAGEFSEDQGYLDEAPLGIGARRALSFLEGAGGTLGVHLIDLEQGWTLEHLNLGLGTGTADPFGGESRPGHEHHGTAVAGELLAKPDAGGAFPRVEGILPEAAFSVASHYFGENTPAPGVHPDPEPLHHTNGHVANAIVATLLELSDHGGDLGKLRGKVLLLEVQRARFPTEVDDADFNAIRLAVALGVTVVEAAGNRGADLDAYRDAIQGRILNPRAGGYRTSGALLVGAAHAALPHDRAPFSNFGGRVDCYAWGDQVTSTGFGTLHGTDTDGFTDYFTSSFNGTSSASPIIAGAAALLQALSWKSRQLHLLPAEVRKLLKDPATGTPQGPRVSGHIGVMPDLEAILQDTACLAPDLYVRCHPGDQGEPRRGDVLTSSPDIVIDYPPRPNPAELYVNDQGWPYLPAIGCLPGKGKYDLYVRLRNRGGSKLEDVRTYLFEGPAATLITPERWKPVKPTPFSEPCTVASGDGLHISSAHSWNAGSSRPYAFLAVARKGPPSRPQLPPSGEYFDWRHFLAFLRRKDVACRNVHVVPTNWISPGRMTFEITGTPDRARRFDLEVLQRLPATARLELILPESLGRKILQRLPWLEVRGVTSGPPRLLNLALPPGGCLRIPSLSLPRGACYRARFRFSSGTADPGHSQAVRQLYRGREVGRVTFQFIDDLPLPPPDTTE